MQPGIFHPRYFDSSRLLLNWVESNDLVGKTIIEVGSGSGIASLRAAQKGANVWSIDINPRAIALLKKNAEQNGISITALESDLFDRVDNTHFDFLLINPPFYPKNPANDAEKAWFCGAGFEYFHSLFQQLRQRAISSGIIMTLSDDCDLETIQAIAKEQGYQFELRRTKSSVFEKNFLFEITG